MARKLHGCLLPDNQFHIRHIFEAGVNVVICGDASRGKSKRERTHFLQQTTSLSYDIDYDYGRRRLGFAALQNSNLCYCVYIPLGRGSLVVCIVFIRMLQTECLQIDSVDGRVNHHMACILLKPRKLIQANPFSKNDSTRLASLQSTCGLYCVSFRGVWTLEQPCQRK